MEHMNGSMPGSSSSAMTASKAKMEGGEKKKKVVRLPRACLVCRATKMKCVGGSDPPCVRCVREGVDCVFVESRRGRQPKKREPRPEQLLDQPLLRTDKHKENKRKREPSTGSSSGGSSSSSNYASGSGSAHTSNAPTTDASSISPPLHHPQSPQPHPLASLGPVKSPPFSTDFTLNHHPHQSSGKGPVSSKSRKDKRPSYSLPSSSAKAITPLSLPPLPSPNTTSTLKFSTDHPLGVLADAASLTNTTLLSGAVGGIANLAEEPTDIGIASVRYFERQAISKNTRVNEGRPEAEELLTWEEVEELFELFYAKIHVHSPCVEKSVATAEWVANKSSSLFNAICCLSARYHPTKSVSLSLRLRDLIKKELAKFPTEKSLECVQAQILYCGWALIPPDNLDSDCTWLRVGITLRLAIDLNLHRGPSFWSGIAIPEWRLKSIQRTWLVCVVTDRTICLQLGKPSLNWTQTETTFSEDPRDSPDDRRVFAQVELSHMLGESLNQIKGDGRERQPGELPELAINFERRLEDWRDRWIDRVVLGPLSDEQQVIRQSRIKLYSHNAHLMVASVILQLAVNNDSDGYAAFALAKFQTAALALLHTFLDEMVATGFSPYLTDFHLGFVLYGALSLLKSVQSQFRHCLVDKTTAGKLINATADGLEAAACSWDHLPFLQSKFLRRVLKARLPEYQAPPRTTPLPLRLHPPSSTSMEKKARVCLPEGLRASSTSSRDGGDDPMLAPGIVDAAGVFDYDYELDLHQEPATLETDFFDSSVMDFTSWPDLWMGGPSLGVYSRAPSRPSSPPLY